MILEVKNLHANVAGKEVLRGINFEVRPGEVHAIMGPNGSGKSTFASVLAGNPKFEVTAGEVLYDGVDLLSLPIEERARQGLFLGLFANIPNIIVSLLNIFAVSMYLR